MDDDTVTANGTEEVLDDRAEAPGPLLVIKPGRPSVRQYFGEIYQHRDLTLMLALRDLKLRYRQTALGVTWVILQPLLAAAILAFVFGRVAHLPTDGVPYFVFAYAGMLAWNVFSQTMTRCSASIVANASLVSKIFFPRLILPISTAAAVVLDFCVASLVMIVLLVINRIGIGPRIVLVPVWLGLLLMLSMGIGAYLAALAVSYRDVPQVMPVLTQLLLYASPVAYSVHAVPARYHAWYRLSPLVSLLEGFRWSVLGTARPPTGGAVYAAAVSVGLFVVGVTALQHMEKRFADVI